MERSKVVRASCDRTANVEYWPNYKTMDTNTNYLRTLANVCESISKIQVPPLPAYSHQGALPVYQPPTGSPQTFTYSSNYTLTPPLLHGQQPLPLINCYEEYPTPHFSHLSHSGNSHQAVGSMPASLFPTPPSTPTSSNNSSSYNGSTHAVQVQDSMQESTNPVLRNKVANEQFKLYLDRTWPEHPPRRSSSVIRASLYLKIAELLQDESAKGRLKIWVKQSGFFMIERDRPGVRYEACLAVPAIKGRCGRGSKSKGSIKQSHSYKLVARLEDFAHIIGTYHNDCKGHYGIRKTYSMVSVR